MILIRALFVVLLFIPVWLIVYRDRGFMWCLRDGWDFIKTGPADDPD